jgi:hypothetical protein
MSITLVGTPGQALALFQVHFPTLEGVKSLSWSRSTNIDHVVFCAFLWGDFSPSVSARVQTLFSAFSDAFQCPPATLSEEEPGFNRLLPCSAAFSRVLPTWLPCMIPVVPSSILPLDATLSLIALATRRSDEQARSGLTVFAKQSRTNGGAL